jgi:hypothetical protein
MKKSLPCGAKPSYMRVHFALIALVPALLVMGSCKKSSPGGKPVVTTAPVTGVGQSTASSGGDVTSDGGSAVTDRGLGWSTDSGFSQVQTTSDGNGIGAFTSAITQLQPGTTYYVHAYATNSIGTAYGATVQFTTTYTPNAYTVTTIAGTGTSGETNGPALSATFNNPVGVAVDKAGNVYIADAAGNAIRKIGADENVTTLTTFGPSYPLDLVTDSSGNLYVVQIAGINSNIGDILKISPSGTVSALDTAITPICLDIDSKGNVFVANTSNILRISPGGAITTLPSPFGSARKVFAIAVDADDNLYVSDGYMIEKMDTLGNASFLAGFDAGSGSTDGAGSSARFGNIVELRVDNSGNLYAADATNSDVRLISPAGVVTTIAGHPIQGSLDGNGAIATFDYPTGLAIDGQGVIYVADVTNNKIRKITH